MLTERFNSTIRYVEVEDTKCMKSDVGTEGLYSDQL